MSQSVSRGERDSRYELIRIVSMLLIMASHCVRCTAGGSYAFLEGAHGINYFCSHFVVMFGNVGTYLFIILTCWFSVDKVSFKADRLLKTLWQTWTTCVLCLIIAFIFHIPSLSLKNFIRELMTPFDIQYWFVTTFCVFILALPMLQTLVGKMDDARLKFACMALLFICPFRGIIKTEIMGFFGDFVTVFFVVAYLKRHPQNWLEKHNKLGLTLFMLFVIVCIAAGEFLPEKLFGKNINGGSGSLYILVIRKIRQRTVFQLWGAICTFYAFKHIPLKQSRIINSLARPAFGVYLWHFNLLLRAWIWQHLLHADYLYKETDLYFLLLIFGPVLMYCVFSLIEMLRAYLLDQYLYKALPWNKKIADWIDQHYQWNK